MPEVVGSFSALQILLATRNRQYGLLNAPVITFHSPAHVVISAAVRPLYASTVASAPVSIDIAALNVDIGSSGSCQVATSTIQVSLGTVNRGEFHGKGTTGGQAKRFSIPVFCPTPTDVRIGFFGVSVESDTLALSQASNSASGVGVKLTYGNNPGAAVPDGTSVKINEASNLPILKRVTSASAGTAEAINFNAQYVQTDATVGAGTANSMVTFALEYN